MDKTEVFNLATGEIWVYNLSPKEAVRNAFLQSKSRHNTWDYPPADEIVKVSDSDRTVYAGDFVAILK